VVYRFGPFELDESLYELRREGADLRLRRRSFEVLRFLIEERARVVGKDELLDRIWGRRFVSQSALANCISELRAAFGGELEASAIIRTVYGRGYRFVAKLDEPAPVAGARPSPIGVGEAARESGPRDVFVGRERELERLEAALDAARAGRPQIAVLMGEAGIGKSSIAARFAARARGRGVRVLDGSCSDNGVAPIGWPWPRLLRAVLGDETSQLTQESAAALAHLLPELRNPASERREPDANGGDPPARAFEVAAKVLLGAAFAPLLVIIDDMHLADATSLNLLGFVASQLAELPIMLLCTSQPPGRTVTRPLARVLAELGRHSGSQSLELAPLSRGEVEQLVENSGLCAEVPRLAERIFERSEGNPLFASQLLRLVQDRPATEGAADEVALPPGLSATIPLRLARLSAESRRLLAVASAIGRSFRTHLLRRAAELTPRECLDLLQEAVDARLVDETGAVGAGESFRFRHGLIRAGVYQTLAAGERAEIHRRVGLALRDGGETISGELAGYLAHHLYQSHDPELVKQAIVFGESAARHAARHREFDRSAEHYARAVAAAIEVGLDSLRICDLQLACAAELRRSIQGPRADEMLGKAIERARSLGRFDRLAGAALVWGGFDTIASADPAWCRLIEEALQGIGTQQPLLRASLLLSLGLARLAADPAEVNVNRVREAIAIAEVRQCKPIVRQAQSLLFAFMRGPEQSAESRRRIESFLGAMLAASSGAAQVTSIVATAAHRIEWLQPEDERAGEAITAAERNPQLVGARITRNLMRGKLCEVERDFDTMWRDWLPIPTDGRLPPTFAAMLFGLRREQGRLGELEAPLRTASQRHREVTFWRVLLSLLLAETGRAVEATELLDSLTRNDFGAVPRNGYWLGNAMYAAETASRLAHARSADVLYPLLTPFPDRGALVCKVAFAGPIRLALGRLATLRGDYSDAEIHLDAAERACAAVTAPGFELRSRLARADLFAARGARARADSLRRETRARALELGLAGLAGAA